MKLFLGFLWLISGLVYLYLPIEITRAESTGILLIAIAGYFFCSIMDED